MKTNIAEITAEKLEEIRNRYSPPEVPKCCICGADMTIQRMSASRVTYGCTGALYDETGCHFTKGRNFADAHYEESRKTIVDVSDPDVLALVEALENAQRANNSAPAILRQLAEEKQKRGEVAAATAFNYAASALQKELSK